MRKSQDLWVATTPDEMYDLLDQQPDWNVVAKRYSKTEYIDVTCTLDIETYNTPEDGYLYTIQSNIRGQNFLYRYIEDFVKLVNRIGE